MKSEGLRFSSSREIFLFPCSWKTRGKKHLSLTVVLTFIGQKEIPDIQRHMADCIKDGPKLDKEYFVIDVSMVMECVLLGHESG